MVTQSAWRAHDNMAAIGQFALFAPRIHATDAGNDAAAGLRIQPGQFAMHLHRQLAGWRHHQRQRGTAALEALGFAQQRCSQRQAIGDRLARSGLGRNQQVAPGFGGQHGGLDRGRLGIVALGQRAGKGRVQRGKRHEASQSGGFGRKAIGRLCRCGNLLRFAHAKSARCTSIGANGR